MRPAEGELLHFSEDPTITRFVPHVAATAQQPTPYVWAVDATRAPDYWFPRDCPRAMAWLTPATTPADRDRILGPGGGDRVHAIEYAWLDRLHTTRLFAYRFPVTHFHPFGSPTPHAHVATEPVDPLAPPTPVGDLLQLHADAGIQLRILTNLWTFAYAAAKSTLGIRLRNAHPPL